MKVLVTGGAGFIGSQVVDRLLECGHEVLVLDALLPVAHDGKPDYLNDSAEYVFGDLRDAGLLRSALAGIDAVSHQAAMVGLGVNFGDAPAYVAHNDLGTAVLLAALAESDFRGRFVLGSSMVVYGDGAYRCRQHGPVRPTPRRKRDLDAGKWEPTCPRCAGQVTPLPITEDAVLDPRNVYAATKLHQEQLCAVFGHETGVPVTVLRYHNVYGPRMPRDTPYAGVAAIFRSALERKEAPRVFEDGGQTRDFVHVEDVARANVLALTRPEPVEGPFNIASGSPHTIADLARALISAFPNSTQPEVSGGYRLGDVRHVFASPQKARDELGFVAGIGFEEGMRAFCSVPLRG